MRFLYKLGDMVHIRLQHGLSGSTDLEIKFLIGLLKLKRGQVQMEKVLSPQWLHERDIVAVTELLTFRHKQGSRFNHHSSRR